MMTSLKTMSDKRLILVQTTTETRQQAESIAAILLEKQQLACVHIHGPMTAMYHWQNNVQKHDEFVLIAKTLEQNFSQVADLIGQYHSYEVPEIIAVPIQHVSDRYMNWIMSCHE